MKKLSILFLLISSFAFAQVVYVPSKITFKNGKVMDAKILFGIKRGNVDVLDEHDITDVFIRTGEKNGKYVKYPVADVKQVEFVDLQNRKRTFKWVAAYRNLVEVKYQGKISWYRLFSRLDNTTQMTDYLQKGNDQRIVLSLFSDNKKNLEALTSDKPELVPLIEKINYNNFKEEDLLEVLKKYND